MSMYPYASSALWPFMGLPLAPVPQRIDADKVPPPEAPTGEPKTGDQTLGWSALVGGADNWLSGYAGAPPGNYRIWRLIGKDPTVKIARRLVVGPILSASRSFEVRQQPGQKKKRKQGPVTGDGVISDPLDKRAEFVDGVLSRLLPKLIGEMATSLYLGHKPFEAVWDVKAGMDVIKQFRPLRNESTQLIVENKTGPLVGLRHNNVEIFGPDAFNFASEPEDDYPYGTPRAESCREDWWQGLSLRRKLFELAQKATGITFGVQGPVGTGKKDSNGNAVDGSIPANGIANEVAKMRPFWMPSAVIPYDPEQVKNPEYLKAWTAANEIARFKLEQFDWGDTAPAAMSILAQLAEIDVRIMHAFCRPQREAMEGTHGTKAEAGVHGQIGVTDSDLLHADYCKAIEEGPVNDLLTRNFGDDARDSVYLEPAPIQDAQKQFLATFLADAQTNPQNSQDMYKKLDKAKAFDDLDIPVREDLDANEDPEPIIPLPAPGGPPVPANGNGRMNGKNGVKLSREAKETVRFLNKWSDGGPAPEPQPTPRKKKTVEFKTSGPNGTGRITGAEVTED